MACYKNIRYATTDALTHPLFSYTLPSLLPTLSFPKGTFSSWSKRFTTRRTLTGPRLTLQTTRAASTSLPRSPSVCCTFSMTNQTSQGPSPRTAPLHARPYGGNVSVCLSACVHAFLSGWLVVTFLLPACCVPSWLHRGTDDGFCSKATTQHKDDPFFLVPKTRSPQFGIKHYAGSVWYTVRHAAAAAAAAAAVVVLVVVVVVSGRKICFASAIECAHFLPFTTYHACTCAFAIPTNARHHRHHYYHRCTGSWRRTATRCATT